MKVSSQLTLRERDGRGESQWAQGKPKGSEEWKKEEGQGEAERWQHQKDLSGYC